MHAHMYCNTEQRLSSVSNPALFIWHTITQCTLTGRWANKKLTRICHVY